MYECASGVHIACQNIMSNMVCVFHPSVNELKGSWSWEPQWMEALTYLEDHVIDPNFPAITAAVWINSH